MSLYLSRLCLNPLFAPALRLAADPYEVHRKLLDTLPCSPKPKPAGADQPKTASVLFRIDTTEAGPDILLQTDAPPDWDALELAPRALRCPPQTKPYAPEFTPGRQFAFRLLCQPAFRMAGRFGLKSIGKRMPGPRRACRDDEQRLEWLRRKAQTYGFAVESVGLTIVDWANTKPLQARGGAALESRDQPRKRAFGEDGSHLLCEVRFDCVIAVIDPNSFALAVRSGVGPQKAFGFGLLSVAPIP